MTKFELINLEIKYLEYKSQYYIGGTSKISDAEFDYIEKVLKENNSTAVSQVGYKIKDFDWPHQSRMNSLSKIQTEENDNKEKEFKSWVSSRILKLNQIQRISNIDFESSPKFDGNAVGINYYNGDLKTVLTRGDGKYGKNIYEKLKNKLPKTLYKDNIVESIEIRFEAVIDINVFNKLYADKFANARNFVAGYLGSDELNEDIEQYIDLMPVKVIMNGKVTDLVKSIKAFNNTLTDIKFNDPTEYIKYFSINEYNNIYNYYVELRKNYKYQLDGIVISFADTDIRQTLGENDHDPEWSVAIKFVPEEAVTEVIGIEWNVGKTGELAPVVLLKPVQLAGTIVKRASVYNLGFVKDNHLGVGSIVTLVKSGDIIPLVLNVIHACGELQIPDVCPKCHQQLEVDGIHLMCINEQCIGKNAKNLAYGIHVLDIKRVGPATIAPFADDFSNMTDLLLWIQQNLKNKNYLPFIKYGFDIESRSFEIFVEGFSQLTSIDSNKIIQCMGVQEVGKSLSKELSKFYVDQPADFKGFTKTLVAEMCGLDAIKQYNEYIKLFNTTTNCKVIEYKPQEISSDSIYIEMTGSPKEFGYKTKDEFIKTFKGKVISSALNKSECQYLVTDDLNSTSSKMKTAAKKGIKIVTYSQLANMFK